MDRLIQQASAGRTGSTLTRQIRRRLLMGLLVSILVAAGAIGGGLWAYLKTSQARDEIMTEATFIQDHLSNLDNALMEEVFHTRAYLITGDEQSVTQRDLAHQTSQQEYDLLQPRLSRLAVEPTRELQDLMAVRANYDALATELIALRRLGQIEAAVQRLDQRSDPLVLQLLAARRDLQVDVQAALITVRNNYSMRTNQIILDGALVFLAGVVASSWLVMQLLASPVSSLDYIEQALIETARAEAVRPVRLPSAMGQQHGPMFQSYNSLVARLEDSEVSRLSFLSSMTHALQTQLASILGYASLLDDPAWQSSFGAHAQYARIIVRQARQMGKTLEDMVTVALIDDDRFEISLMPLRVEPLVAAVADEARQLSGREIQLEDHLGPALVMGDALRLREVLSRLIDNACKFSAPDTPVQLSLRPSSTSGCIEIAIIDHGLGIADSDVPLLFRRMGRIKNKQTQGIAGSGLGLYITKYIIERHHGQITVRSQPGQETAFIVTLSLAEKSSSEAVSTTA